MVNGDNKWAIPRCTLSQEKHFADKGHVAGTRLHASLA